MTDAQYRQAMAFEEVANTLAEYYEKLYMCPACKRDTLTVKAGVPYEIEKCTNCGYIGFC